VTERSEETTNNSQPSMTTAKVEGLEVWRLCNQYTVVQAALLVAGHDPATAKQVEELRPEQRPPGYEAAKHALEQALTRDRAMGVVYLDQRYPGFHFPLDPENSIIWASSLKTWLSERGIKTGFFFDANNRLPSDDRPDYLNPDHRRYSPKLAAAVQAWQAYDDQPTTNGKSPKQALAAWLKENAVRIGLVDKEGKPNSTGIKEAAKVANWKTEGGAPKTPSKAG
jgi:hypothetical protein